jgi:signal transduction histidine kinase
MIPSGGDTIKKLARLMAAPTIERSERAAHIRTVEKDIVLPLKGLIVIILFSYFFLSDWKNPRGENQPPFIVSFMPRSGPVGTLVVVDGYNFSPVIASNTLRFGGVIAKVTFASSNQLTAVVPTGAVSAPISLIVEGRAFVSHFPFEVTSATAEVPFTNFEADLASSVSSGSNATKPSSNNAKAKVQAAREATKNAKPLPSDIARSIAMDCMKPFLILYLGLNAIAGAIFASKRPLSLKQLEWIVFGTGVLDAALMTGLTFLTEGFESNLYWVFLALILRNALSIPVALPQILLNSLVTLAYVIGGQLDKSFIVPFAQDTEPRSNLFIERLIVLVAWSICCYSIQVLFEKQKRAEAEATEFAVRQERLHTAGRLAAEIAHQIKNPLGIITNAAFCLERAVRDGEMAVDEQIQIIREEVDRADQIITELMGYAQLAEGKVERLEVAEELNSAIQEVFPPAAKYKVRVKREFGEDLPVLLMQKRHLSGVLVNLLQNAREAMNGNGEIIVGASYGGDDSIIIAIEDTGPGIPSDKIDKIFDAYFTTREKGTGLGLAIVKHNTEMYGGSVTVQSELGKGTKFVVNFPSRILMRLSK